MCVLTEPAVFDQDGTVVLLDAVPEAGGHASVREAVLICPSGAITVVER